MISQMLEEPTQLEVGAVVAPRLLLRMGAIVKAYDGPLLAEPALPAVLDIQLQQVNHETVFDERSSYIQG